MVKILPIEQDGMVIKALPGAEFDVELPNKHIVRAYLSGRMRKFYISIIPGDKVRLALPPYDLSKGCIVHRYKPELIKDEQSDYKKAAPKLPE